MNSVLAHLDLIELRCKDSLEKHAFAAESFELKTVCLSAADWPEWDVSALQYQLLSICSSWLLCKIKNDFLYDLNI